MLKIHWEYIYKYIIISEEKIMKLKAIAFFASLALINCGNLISADTSYQANINGINYGPSNSICNACKRGEVCTLKPGGKALQSCKPYCGDGIVVGVETGTRRCDDGNANAKDGCTNCYVDNLYACQG
jgi:cysteine-rich repeat protein